MTARLVVLFLACYRVTLLVTSDRITRAPRRALLDRFRRRAHHVAKVEQEGDVVVLAECACRWRVARISPAYPATAALVSDPVPTALEGLDLGRLGVADYLGALRAHIADNADDVGRFGYLLTCPWCVGFYVGIAGAVLWAWVPDGWWFWPALAFALSGFTGLAASLGAPDDGDDQ